MKVAGFFVQKRISTGRFQSFQETGKHVGRFIMPIRDVILHCSITEKLAYDERSEVPGLRQMWLISLSVVY